MSMTRGKCSVDGCESGHYGRGLCRNHLYRFDRYGDPLGFPPKPTIAERFWPKVRKEPGGCWVWTANLVPRGYGHFSVNGKKTPAHRVAYQLMVGEIPSHLELDHVCHTNDKSCKGGSKCPHRRCVNPAHLEPVTHLENTRRGRHPGNTSARKPNSKPSQCANGHDYTPENTYTNPGGRRHCRQCNRDAARRYNDRKKASR